MSGMNHLTDPCDCCLYAVDATADRCRACSLPLTQPHDDLPLTAGDAHDRLRWARTYYLSLLTEAGLRAYAERLCAAREAYIKVYGANPRKG